MSCWSALRSVRAACRGAALLLLGAVPADGVATTECRTTAVTELPGESKEPDLDQGPGACGSAMDNAVAFMTSTAGADFGALFARAEGTYLEGDTDRALATANASFRDTITVTSPGLEGQAGRVEALARLSGFVDLTGSGNGEFAINVAGASGVIDGISASCSGGSPTGCLNRPYPAAFEEVFPLAFDVQFGVPTSLSMSLAAQAGRNSISSGPGTSDVNFGSTAYWGGIEQVTFQGAPVAFEISSESGTDYAVPAPEPGQAVLAATGALALALAARRRGAGRAGVAADGRGA